MHHLCALFDHGIAHPSTACGPPHQCALPLWPQLNHGFRLRLTAVNRHACELTTSALEHLQTSRATGATIASTFAAAFAAALATTFAAATLTAAALAATLAATALAAAVTTAASAATLAATALAAAVTAT